MNLQLLYVSVATEAMCDDDLGRIEASSLTFNALNGITGLLCFDGARFIQLLEGREQLVERLLERLKIDPRHKDLETLYGQPIQYKSYGEWAMRCVGIGADGNGARDMELLLVPSLPSALTTIMRRFVE